jgi:hypothetical protein
LRNVWRFVNARWFLVCTVGLVIAVAGGALAAAGGSGTISACVHRKGGALYEAKKCAKGHKSLTWNAKGQAGAPGSWACR